MITDCYMKNFVISSVNNKNCGKRMRGHGGVVKCAESRPWIILE